MSFPFTACRRLLLGAAVWCGAWAAQAQAPPAALDWPALADSTLGEAVRQGDIPGATVLVTDRVGTRYYAGLGHGRLDGERPVTDSTLFEVGSIGKVLTAMAVLREVERGRLDLAQDVNAYLEGWQVAPPDAALTLHHLLTHTGGLNDRALGYAVRRAEDVEPLGAHLAEHFPTFFAVPGRYVSYSNYGYGLAGYAVEAVTRTPFADYVSGEILAPLGIQDSGYIPAARADLATGYQRQGEGFVAAPVVFRPVTPAGSFVASARDMGRLLRALLDGGSSVLSRSSVERMTSVQHTPHPALMGTAYGLEESRWGSVQGFGKGGSIPGFTAYMALLPREGIGLFAAVNGSTDAPIDRFVLAAIRQLSRGSGPAPAEPVPLDPSRFAGEYRSNRYDRASLEKLLNFQAHRVHLTADSAIALWHEGALHTYRPVSANVFQQAEDPHRRVAFEVNEQGEPTHAFLNDRVAGGYVPVVWERNGFWDSNAYVNEYFGVVVLIGLSYLLWPVAAVLAKLLRRERRRGRPGIVLAANAVGFLTSAALLAYIVTYFVPLLRGRAELVFGVPEALSAWAGLPVLVLGGFAAFSALWAARVWRERRLSAGLGYGLLFATSGVLIADFVVRWNLI